MTFQRSQEIIYFLAKRNSNKIILKFAYPRKFMVKIFRTVKNRNFNEGSYLSWTFFFFFLIEPSFSTGYGIEWRNGTQSL